MASSNRVLTGVVRVAYVHVDKPYAFQNEEPKRQLMVMVKKDDDKTLAKIERAIKAVKASDRGKQALKGAPKDVTFLRDGDEEDKGPEFRGHYFFNCKSGRPVALADENGDELLDASEIYSGCYCRVSFEVFAYNRNGNKGLSTQLRAVKKVKDGPSMGGFVPVDLDTEFEDDDDDFLG